MSRHNNYGAKKKPKHVARAPKPASKASKKFGSKKDHHDSRVGNRNNR